MSTPSGKPFDPFDVSAYAPKRARKRSEADWQDAGQSSTEPSSGDDDVDQVLPYGLKNRSHPAERSEHPVDFDQDDASAPESENAAEQPASDGQELGEGAETTGTPLDGKMGDDDGLDFADAPGLVHANPSSASPAAQDDDIERLESSLRWLRREGAAGRLPRAAQLPPVRGLAQTRSFPRKSDTYINGFRLPRSLEPEFVPPPPMRARRDHLRGPMRIVIASVIAAPIAYYFTTGGTLPELFTNRTAKLASLETHVPQYAPIEPAVQPRDPAESLSPRGETVGMLPPAPNPETNAAASGPAAAAGRVPGKDAGGASNKTAALPPPDTAPVQNEISSVTKDSPRPSPASNQASAPSRPLHRLDPEDIKLLVQQGEQFVAAGDVVTARVVFQRAAEAGDARAALAMGATYDPIVLDKLGVRGIAADVEKARSWYQKARDFGSPEAPRRLEMLANR